MRICGNSIWRRGEIHKFLTLTTLGAKAAMTTSLVNNAREKIPQNPQKIDWSRKIRFGSLPYFHDENLIKYYFPLEAELALTSTGESMRCVDFLSPNERRVKKIAEHLKGLPPGWFVSTGTERSFFDLILADRSTCHGMIIRDINPTVQSYNNCLIMLLRIANNHQDFIQLSRFPTQKNAPRLPPQELQSKAEIIRERLLADKLIAKPMREYYLENLETLTEAYFTEAYGSHWDKHPAFETVNYLHHEKAFLKLQRYAREGRIISTVGKIDDLCFLEDRGVEVSLIDTSNIEDYTLLDMKNFWGAKIVRTSGSSHMTVYYAGYWNPLSVQEKQKFDAILKELFSIKKLTPKYIPSAPLFLREYGLNIPPEIPIGYNKECFEALQKIHRSLSQAAIEGNN